MAYGLVELSSKAVPACAVHAHNPNDGLWGALTDNDMPIVMGEVLGYAPARCAWLCEGVPSSTLVVSRPTSRRTGHRHAARPRHGTSTPRLKTVAASYCRSALACRREVGLASVRDHVDEAVPQRCRAGHDSFRWRRVASIASFACCASWRGRSCASGFMAATVRRKQFPRRCAASSRNKFFAPPGPPRTLRPQAVQLARPPPDGPQQGRDGRDLG